MIISDKQSLLVYSVFTIDIYMYIYLMCVTIGITVILMG